MRNSVRSLTSGIMISGMHRLALALDLDGGAG